MGSRPNVILILVDDMGFSDLGITGSEIKTPNIDQLAKDGALLSSMYNCSRCCPTRASLLTGLYPHSAGVGHMGTNLGSKAYQGFLRNDSATIAEVLRASGYRTMMSGKWHVAGDFEARELDDWCAGDVLRPGPRQRGFDQFYGILDGVTHFFSPHNLIEEDRRLEVSDPNYYFTDAINQKAMEMIRSAVKDDQPYFLYLAHTAPHWPLHARDEDIAKYENTYVGGWDATRTARHEEMNSLGILQTPWNISPRDEAVSNWQDIDHKIWQASKMAAYAAMIDRLDQSVGELVAELKRLDELDDTLILFLSDNGGCAEFMAEDGWAQYYPNRTWDNKTITMGNVENLKPGNAQTFQSYDKPWANVSNTPFRKFKHYVHEGGISTPLIAHWPGNIKPGQIAHSACHVVDILPTILEATGSAYLTELDGHEVQPLQGESFMSLLRGHDWHRQQPIFFEHEGNSAIRLGQFKLVREHGKPWELYDMEVDRTELINLAGKNQPLESELLKQYQHFEWANGVEDWQTLLPKLLVAWNLNSVDG